MFILECMDECDGGAWIYICYGGDIKHGNVNLGRSGGATPQQMRVLETSVSLAQRLVIVEPLQNYKQAYNVHT